MYRSLELLLLCLIVTETYRLDKAHRSLERKTYAGRGCLKSLDKVCRILELVFNDT